MTDHCEACPFAGCPDCRYQPKAAEHHAAHIARTTGATVTIVELEEA